MKKQPAENMGYPGVELTWKPGTDDNWVSYYQILRNGAAIDRVAKGSLLLRPLGRRRSGRQV